MKYIKKYEIKRYVPSKIYKDGDIVFLKKNKQKEHEVDGGALRYTDMLEGFNEIRLDLENLENDLADIIQARKYNL